MLDLNERLRLEGLSTTAQRLAVFHAVSSMPHATADAIIGAVTSAIGTVSRQAVYDTLHLFVDHGLIRRIQPTGSVALYEDRIGDNHHHVVCRECGFVIDVDCAVGDTPCLTAADAHGFVIDEAEVAYWGICPTCQGVATPGATR